MVLDNTANAIVGAEITEQIFSLAGQESQVGERAEFYPSGKLKSLTVKAEKMVQVGGTNYPMKGAMGFDEKQHIRLITIAQKMRLYLFGRNVQAFPGDMLVFNQEGLAIGLIPSGSDKGPGATGPT